MENRNGEKANASLFPLPKFTSVRQYIFNFGQQEKYREQLNYFVIIKFCKLACE
jgi:hypothetical protein